MSESKQQIPTNEEIVNELTKDIEQQFTINNDTVQNNVTEPDTEHSGIPEDFEHSDNEPEPKPVDDDYVDETVLKDAEISLSDEEKTARHKESLTLKTRGNEEYKAGKYVDSVKTYTEALRLCPLKFDNDRSVFYANRAASKMKINRTESAIDDCTKAIELNDKYVRAYLRRAKLYEDTEKLDESLKDYETILVLDPGNVEALKASTRLPPLINERNEKMKNEMFGKLLH